MVFTLEQKSHMVECYFRNGSKVDGVWSYSVQLCFEDYQERYPEVVDYRLFQQTVYRCVEKFRSTSSIERRSRDPQRTARTVETVQLASQIMTDNPKTSIRKLSQQLNVSVGSCHKLLHNDLDLYPYRIVSISELKPPDYPKRMDFCNFFLQTFNNNEYGFNHTFFTDEAWFYLQGYVNSQNMRIWSATNPHEVVEAPLHPQKIGVWAAISPKRIIGPIFFEGNLNQIRYRQEILTPFFNGLSMEEKEHGYFQQDGATCHCTHETLQYIQDYYGQRIISRNTATPFPPRSCDLTPCDFFLWPYLKNTIFSTPILNLTDLKERISNKIQEINNNPIMLANVANGLKRRIQFCIEANGEHINAFL